MPELVIRSSTKSPKRRHQRYKARPFRCNKVGSCRTGDFTAHPTLKEGRTHRTALQFSSPAFLIVEESMKSDLTQRRPLKYLWLMSSFITEQHALSSVNQPIATP